MSEPIQFSKPATYHGYRQVEASCGAPADGRRLILREIPGHPGYWNLYRPGEWATRDGVGTRGPEVLVMVAESLAEGKRLAALLLSGGMVLV